MEKPGVLGQFVPGSSTLVNGISMCATVPFVIGCELGVCTTAGYAFRTYPRVTTRAYWNTLTCYPDLLAMANISLAPVVVFTDQSGDTYSGSAVVNEVYEWSPASNFSNKRINPDRLVTLAPYFDSKAGIDIILPAQPVYLTPDLNNFFLTRLNYPSAAAVTSHGGSVTYNISVGGACSGYFALHFTNCFDDTAGCLAQYNMASSNVITHSSTPTPTPTISPDAASSTSISTTMLIVIIAASAASFIGVALLMKYMCCRGADGDAKPGQAPDITTERNALVPASPPALASDASSQDSWFHC